MDAVDVASAAHGVDLLPEVGDTDPDPVLVSIHGAVFGIGGLGSAFLESTLIEVPRPNRGAVGVGQGDQHPVFEGSQAVAELRPSAAIRHPYVLKLRDGLDVDGSLAQKGNHLVFTRDVEFSSPSAGAAVVHGGGANGLLAWKTQAGKTLKALEA